jgi:hypothetical protein
MQKGRRLGGDAPSFHELSRRLSLTRLRSYPGRACADPPTTSQVEKWFRGKAGTLNVNARFSNSQPDG